MKLEPHLHTFDAQAYGEARSDLVEVLAAVQREIEVEAGSLRRATDVKQRSAKYLHYPYMPQGELVAIAGAGDSGKTFFLTKFAAEVSRGGHLPPAPGRKPIGSVPQGDVLILQRENDEAVTVVPRYSALGGDLSRLVLPNEHFSFGTNGLDSYLRLAWYIEASGAKFVFIDPITGYIDADTKNTREVRVVLERIQAIARFTGATIVYISHLNKDYQSPIRERIMGSAEFFNVPRSVLFVTQDPAGVEGEDLSDHLVFQEKNNLGRSGGPIAFRLKGDLEEGSLEWHWLAADQSTGLDKIIRQLSGTEEGEEKRDLPGKVRDLVVKTLIASDQIVPVSKLRYVIAEELGTVDREGKPKIAQSTWDRAKSELPFGPIEVKMNDRTHRLEPSPGSGVWGFYPLRQAFDGAIVEERVAEA